MNKIFVIIVTYNGKIWYDRCLGSLQKSVIPVQTVVVDNGSSDESVDYIKTHFPEIQIFAFNKNLGFGQGNNKGIRYALDQGADYVFLLNQDAWIEPDTISELIRIHQENPNFGILSPMHLNVEKTEIEKGLMCYIADYRTTSTKFINDLYFGNLAEVYETNYVNAAAWLLPRITLETIGGFDPIFFHYGEDDNYMQRVLYHGFKIGICPKTTVCHDTIRRIYSEEKAKQNTNKNFLVELTNINNPISTTQYISSFTCKLISNLLKFNLHRSKRIFNNILFLFHMKKNITYSRKTNIQKEKNWL